jgi:hypothetical protein
MRLVLRVRRADHEPNTTMSEFRVFAVPKPLGNGPDIFVTINTRGYHTASRASIHAMTNVLPTPIRCDPGRRRIQTRIDPC